MTSFVRIAAIVGCTVTVAACSSSPVVLTPSGGVRTQSPTAAPVATATPVATASPAASAAPIASPSPAPTVAPTASSAASPIVANPSSLAFINDPMSCPNNTSISFTVSESGYSGTFTAASSNANVLTVVATGAGAFTATEANSDTSSSSATVTVKDTLGNTLAIPATFGITCISL